ncbi:hypothetical protein [Paracoccus pacificus]|uniref:Uncharacterized protein n=1 Tax=Paracoccus pacificus TaxID=1463598 RepID=A0ABW4R6I9_9RHOB
MTQPGPLPPDPVPLREALRGLRHALRRGGRTVADTVPLSAMPAPAAKLAQALMRRGEEIASGIDTTTSMIARTLLPADRMDAPTLALFIQGGRDADGSFAAVSYDALSDVLTQIGAGESFVSEAAAQQVWTAFSADAPLAATGAKSALAKEAARLSVMLLNARVIRDVKLAPATDRQDLTAEAVAPLAIFALMLWLLADHDGRDDAAALKSAVEVSARISADISRAASVGNTARLAQLLGEFAACV